MQKRFLLACLSVIGLAFLLESGLCAARPQPPDLTRGGKKDDMHDWTLGPTGARGWVWGWHCQTTDARQILVTKVAAGSPADGVLQEGDVLLGVDGKRFDSDARLQLARAVTQAEKEESRGILHLVRWRRGRVQNVEVKLAVLGAYGATAPYDCPKSQRILEQGCQAIAKQGWKDARGDILVSIEHDLNALALLASGREPYRPLVAQYARKVAGYQPGGHISWGYAYETLFLAEYALATKNAAVMPGLRRLALDIARGQSGVGTWGHSFARPSDGILDGYGCMNQPGIVLTLAMAVAREAGVADPDLDRAIVKGAGFLRWYVNKGAIPYGDHDPWPWHEDNGKCSSAAVLFDLLGDREAAGFFSRMGAAAYAERESGHTGNFFNVLWAMPGVSRCGPPATGAYFQETGWYYDLARGWDGRFTYQDVPADSGSYEGWDCTGAYLLAYALPLRRTIVTGRKPCVVPALSREAVAETIAAGRDFTIWTEQTCYDPRSTEQLLTGLSSWSPAVRKRSAHALGRREGDFIPRLLALLAGADRDSRYGACEALGCLGPKADPAAREVRGLLADRDPWLRILAADALVRMGPRERIASVPHLLRAVAVNDPADRRNRVAGALAEALFTPGPGKREPRSILSGSLEGVDRSLLYAAIRDILKNEDGRIRGLVAPVYKLLGPEDIAVLLPDIVAATEKPAPSGEMFAYEIRMAGVELLSRLRIREGMPLCVDFMNERRWGRDFFRPARALAGYGGAAREMLPRLRGETREIAKKEGQKELDALETLIARIEADSHPKPLRSMADFIREPAVPE
ncbi:MAG: DUF6288 domain-containing protein [Thermoguttaceae bacterium]